MSNAANKICKVGGKFTLAKVNYLLFYLTNYQPKLRKKQSHYELAWHLQFLLPTHDIYGQTESDYESKFRSF